MRRFALLRLAALPLVTAAAAPLRAEVSPTPAVTEGPFYKPGSPERATLFGPSDPGKRFELTGKVLSSGGRPVAGAWIDVWQADARGRYDNAGYAYRGHVFTDISGDYAIRTVMPGEYPGRTPHIHVKVRAPKGPVLTTQLFFPEMTSRNREDSIYDPRLVVHWETGGARARFDFVLP